MQNYQHLENKTKYRLCRKIRRALPPQRVGMMCPGCYWGTPLPNGRIHCSFWRSCRRREVRTWK